MNNFSLIFMVIFATSISLASCNCVCYGLTGNKFRFFGINFNLFLFYSDGNCAFYDGSESQWVYISIKIFQNIKKLLKGVFAGHKEQQTAFIREGQSLSFQTGSFQQEAGENLKKEKLFQLFFWTDFISKKKPSRSTFCPNGQPGKNFIFWLEACYCAGGAINGMCNLYIGKFPPR